MIKKILLIILCAAPAFAQGGFPDNSPIISKSIGFVEKLNRVAPFIALKPGTIVSAQNMKRPAPGIMAGWGPRRGMEKNNSTAIGSYAIDSLHQFINPTFGTRCFLAQTNDKIYLATNDPPDTGTTFGTSQINLTADCGDMSSDSIGDDWVGAASSTNPVAWSGGTAYPDGFKVVVGGATPSELTITNSDFETYGGPPTGWTENNASAVGTNAISPYHSSLCMLVTSTTASAETSGAYQDFAAAPGVEYTISYWARRDSLVTASITNADFETGGAPPTGWTESNGTAVTGTTSPHGDSKDVEVTPTTAGSESAGIYQDIAVNASTDYTLSYWAYREDQDFEFTNGTFESGTTGWTANNATLASGTTSPHGGSKDLEVTSTTSDSSKAGAYQDITLEPSTEYTITYWAYSSEPDSSSVSITNADFETGGDPPTGWTEYDGIYGITCTTESGGQSGDCALCDYGALTAYLYQGGINVILGATVSWSAYCYNVDDTATGGVAIVYGVGYQVDSEYSSSSGTWENLTGSFVASSATQYTMRLHGQNITPPTNEAVKWDTITVSQVTESPKPSITVEAYTSGDSLISTPVSTTNSPTDDTWTEYSSTFTTPATTSYVRVYLASNSDLSGQTVEFDDITIAPTSEPYPQTNPSHVMQALDSGKSVLSTLDTQENDPTDSTWTQYSEDVTTPVACAYIRLYLGGTAPSSDFLNTVEFDDVQIATTSGGPYPSHVMQFLDSGSGVLETATTQNNEPTVGEWVQYSAQGISPASTAYIRLYLGCNSTPAGESVYFDYLTSIVAVPPAGLDVTDGYEEVRNGLTTRYIPYPTSIYDPVYIGFRRPVDGVHFYINGTPNSEVQSMNVFYWKGGDSTWNPVGNLVDNTAISSATLAQSGTMTWDHGPDGETPRVLPGTSDDLYWYKFTPSGTLSSGLQVYKITVADDIDEIANLWSGYSVLASGCLLDEGAGYSDYSAEVTDGTDTNHMPLDSLANTSEVYVGCDERAQGINIHMVAGSANGDATVVTVKYWDGDSWVSVGDLVDGTSNGTDSLAQTGMIQWDGDSFREVKMVLGGLKVPYFWYQLSWSNALDADVQVWEISYASKPDPLEKYNGVVNYNNHALWWPGSGGAGTLDYSQQGYPHILNGPYAGSTLPIFGGGEVNAVTMLGTSAIVSTKDPYQTYFVSGADPSTFTSTLVSDKVGAIAPKTLVSIDSGVRLFNTELQVRAATFMAADGIYLTDGTTLLNISGPISDYFDTTSAPYIEPEYMDTAYAWVDQQEKTVHYSLAVVTSGTTTQSALNRELVYGYLTDEWYDIYKRKYAANCGLDVIGSANESLTYIGGFLGYVYRTNYGTSDAGTKITHNFKTSPIMPLQGLVSDPINYSSTLRKVKIKGKADTTSGAVAGVTVYPDGITTGVDAGDISLERSGYGNVGGAVTVTQTGDEFAFEFESDLLDAEMELYGMTLDFMPQRPE